MPTISIFIRKDDLPIWQSIDGKSEWLHQRLTGEVFVMVPGDAKKITEEMRQNPSVEKDEGWSGPFYRDQKKGKL